MVSARGGGFRRHRCIGRFWRSGLQRSSTQSIPPSAPSIHGNTAAGDGSITVLWTAPTEPGVPAFDAYDLDYIASTTRPADGATWTDVTTEPGLTDRSATISPLTNGAAYYVRIAAVAGGQAGDYDVAGPFIPNVVEVPSAPNNVRAVPGASATELIVSWDAPDSQGGAPVTGYTVTHLPADGTNGDADLAELTATITGLTDATEYTVSVTADNSGGSSPAAEATATPTLLPTASITNVPSTTASAGLRLVLEIGAAGIQDMAAGDRVEVFLENDYVVPGSIPTSSVSFIIGGGGTDGVAYGSTIPAASVSVEDGGDIPGTDTDGDAHSIVAEIPDFDPSDDGRHFPNSPSGEADDTLTLVIETSAGILNPSEQGSHSVGYSVLTTTEMADGTAERRLPDLGTKAKISLDSDDGGRGKPITIAGSGFNNGVGAEAFVLIKKTGGAPDCATVVADGTSLGTAHVGTDDKFSIPFTVHQDDFDAGAVNYIRATDYEAPTNRRADDDVEVFEFTPSVTIDPTTLNSGDEVTVKPRDFGGHITSISLGGEQTLGPGDWMLDNPSSTNSDIMFDMPGGLSDTINVSVTDGTDTKRVDIVVVPSSLELSSTSVAPYESVIVSGSGFSEDAYICVGDIKIDGKALLVDNAGTSVVDAPAIACNLNPNPPKI